METITQTERQRHEHKVALTKIYLHILLGRQTRNRLYDHPYTTPSLASALAKNPRTYLDMTEVIHTLTLPDGTTVTDTRPDEIDDAVITRLAEWLCSPLETDAEVNLTRHFDDMPDIDLDVQRLSQINALRVAMAITGEAPTERVASPATKFNEELRDSIFSIHGQDRLRPDSRLGLMSDSEYADERQTVARLSELWPETTANASEIARHVTERFGPRFHLTWPPRAPMATDVPDTPGRGARQRSYANGLLLATDIATFDENDDPIGVNPEIHAIDAEMASVYIDHKAKFARDRAHFTVTDDGTLLDADGQTPFITMRLTRRPTGLEITVSDEFYRYLASLPSWDGLASGVLERELERRLAPGRAPRGGDPAIDDELEDFLDDVGRVTS